MSTELIPSEGVLDDLLHADNRSDGISGGAKVNNHCSTLMSLGTSTLDRNPGSTVRRSTLG